MKSEETPILVENEGDTIDTAQSPKLYFPVLGAGIVLIARGANILVRIEKK